MRDSKYIKEPWDQKCVSSVCVGVIIFVSALFLARGKLITGCCVVLSALCVLCKCRFCMSHGASVNWFAGCVSLVLFLQFYLHVCRFVCWEKDSKHVMHACHPLHAHPCTKETHMTSIWERRDSDLIINSLLLIKTCTLCLTSTPPPPPSFTIFFFLCLYLGTLPPLSTPRLQSRTTLRFLRCLLPKRAPF